MALTQEQTKRTDQKMFSLMQTYNFDKTVVIRKFRKWLKRNNLTITEWGCYKKYDKVLAKVQTFPEFHQNVQQFYRNLGRVGQMVTEEALGTGDIQDFLAMAKLQMDALALKSENHNVVFNQFNDNKVETKINVNPEELLGRISSGLERFGGLIQHAGRIGAIGGDKPILTIPATSKAEVDTGSDD